MTTHRWQPTGASVQPGFAPASACRVGLSKILWAHTGVAMRHATWCISAALLAMAAFPVLARAQVASPWSALDINERYSFEVPASWKVLADNRLGAVNRTTPAEAADVLFQANDYDARGEVTGQVQLRLYPTSSLNQQAIRDFTPLEIADTSETMRDSMQASMAASREPGSRVPAMTLLRWDGVRVQDVGGVAVLVSGYVRSNFGHASDMHVSRLAVYDGDHTFSVVFSRRADRTELVSLEDHVLRSIRRRLPQNANRNDAPQIPVAAQPEYPPGWVVHRPSPSNAKQPGVSIATPSQWELGEPGFGDSVFVALPPQLDTGNVVIRVVPVPAELDIWSETSQTFRAGFLQSSNSIYSDMRITRFSKETLYTGQRCIDLTYSATTVAATTVEGQMRLACCPGFLVTLRVEARAIPAQLRTTLGIAASSLGLECR